MSHPFALSYPQINLLLGRLTLDVLDDSNRGEADPQEGLSDGAAAHLWRPPWQVSHGAFQPGNAVSVRGGHTSTTYPLTCSWAHWASLPNGILCIVTMTGHLVIEVGEVKRVSEAGVQSKTMESGYQPLRCQTGLLCPKVKTLWNVFHLCHRNMCIWGGS